MSRAKASHRSSVVRFRDPLGALEYATGHAVATTAIQA
jgi:hypothetical protein